MGLTSICAVLAAQIDPEPAFGGWLARLGLGCAGLASIRVGAAARIGSKPAAGLGGDPTALGKWLYCWAWAAQVAQMPLISREWRMSAKPAAAATWSAQTSKSGPVTAADSPQDRQMTW